MSGTLTRRVGINAHLLSQQAGYRSAGIHGYMVNLLHHLPAASREVPLDYTVYVGQGRAPADDRMHTARSNWPTHRPLLRIAWEQTVLPWQQMDLFHSLAFVAPIVTPWPLVVTIYDLSFVHYPKAFGSSRRLYLRLFTQLACRRARRILTISESTRRDLVKQWNVPPGRIDLAYPGVGEQYRQLPSDEVSTFRDAKGLPERYILHVGTLQPRKNLVRLVRAYAHLKATGESGLKGVKLVLAGGQGWLYKEILHEIEKQGLDQDVVMPGYVPANELPLWYNAATLLAYPSLYEGFGLPILEAMACGTPVVTSNASSMPEAAGESPEGRAALLVDPYDTEALSEAIHSLLNDSALRDELRDRGFRQAGRFSWQRTASATVASYKRALHIQ